MNFASTKNNKGFSLIEMLLVLGVLAVLLVAAFVVYPRVRDASRANNEVANLTAIKASINNLYATKGGNYSGLTTGVANQARAFPASMNSGTYTGEAITSSWGGEVKITPAAGANSRTFDIEYAAVPEGVCLGLVSGAAGNFKQITVGTKKVLGVTTTTGTGPTATESTTGTIFNPADAAGACTGTVAVKFTSD